MAERDQGFAPYLASWSEIAGSLTWDTPWSELFRERPPLHDWFVDGRLNLSVNCLDRHLADRGDRAAILWEGEPGDRRVLTYRELHMQVVRLAAALRGLGVGQGDRVALHLGWVPEAVAAMMACARIGAEYTVIPVALPAEALAVRVDDFGPKVLFTQDGGWRHGAILPLKSRIDEALEASSGVEHTVVVRRTGVQVDWYEGDRWYDDLLTAADPRDGEPVAVPASHPVACAHLANRRGRPVAIRLGTANLAVVALANHLHVMGEGDVFWGAADISWLGAQAHGVVGPLLGGASTVMYEGTLDVPAPARTWQIIERYGVTAMLTSPSIVRALRGWSLTATGTTRSLRRLTTIGDRLDADLRLWLRDVLGDAVRLSDAWGQLELGGIVTCDEPATQMPDPGFAIVDAQGVEVANGESGEWVMLRPWPGVLRDVEAPDGTDPTSYHWERHPGVYSTGDVARRTVAGDVEFLGRLDEVISVSGQLVSLNEVRDVLRDQPFVTDAEAFETTDQRLGRVVGAAVVLADEAVPTAATLRDLQDAARELLGGLSRPQRLLVVVDRLGSDLDPVTRRRSLAVLAQGHDHRIVAWDQVIDAARHLPAP
jgi:acetyl-CoA synthetase